WSFFSFLVLAPSPIYTLSLHDALPISLKDRPVGKGLILLAADIQQLEPFIDHLDDLQRQRLKNSWPGPVTWLVPDNGRAPTWIRSEEHTSELQSRENLVCRLLLEKKKQ